MNEISTRPNSCMPYPGMRWLLTASFTSDLMHGSSDAVFLLDLACRLAVPRHAARCNSDIAACHWQNPMRCLACATVAPSYNGHLGTEVE